MKYKHWSFSDQVTRQEQCYYQKHKNRSHYKSMIQKYRTEGKLVLPVKSRDLLLGKQSVLPKEPSPKLLSVLWGDDSWNKKEHIFAPVSLHICMLGFLLPSLGGSGQWQYSKHQPGRSPRELMHPMKDKQTNRNSCSNLLLQTSLLFWNSVLKTGIKIKKWATPRNKACNL